MSSWKKSFVTGLVILLPLAITIAFISFIINVLTEPFMSGICTLLTRLNLGEKGFLFLSPEQVIKYTSKLLILILLFAFTILLGFLVRLFFIQTALNLGDKILSRIPIVKSVYKTTQDLIRTLFVTEKNAFKQVVLVPFPRKDVYALGLVSRSAPKVCSDAAEEHLISVLIPTTPNPTTGFLLMYKSSELIFLDMKSSDALKYIVSCGVIVPQISKKRRKK